MYCCEAVTHSTQMKTSMEDHNRSVAGPLDALWMHMDRELGKR
jgi:hypothetical protein